MNTESVPPHRRHQVQEKSAVQPEWIPPHRRQQLAVAKEKQAAQDAHGKEQGKPKVKPEWIPPHRRQQLAIAKAKQAARNAQAETGKKGAQDSRAEDVGGPLQHLE